MNIRVVDTETCSCQGYNRRLDRIINSKSSKKVMAITASIFCYDPYILSLTRTRPFIKDVKDLYKEKIDLLIVPHRNIPEIDTLVLSKWKEGASLLLVQPNERVYNEINDLFHIEYKGEIVSLNERWEYNLPEADIYYYPNNLPLQLLDSKSIFPLSYVGEYPDLYINDRTSVFASDAFHAYEIYRNQIFTLVKDFSIAFVVAVRKILGKEVEEETILRMRSYFDLRRDFHSLGLAIYLVEQLAEKLNKEIDINRVLELAVDASEELVKNRPDLSLINLQKSYKLLYDIRRELAPIDIFLVESPHNGVLYEDMGFSEFGHPEWSMQFLNDLMSLAENKNYKFNYECEARSIYYSAVRFPKTTERLKKLWEEGKVDIVNGTYSQPYPLLYSSESNIRQFEEGIDIFKNIFGKIPKVYQQQEFGFTPQTPQILEKVGIKRAVHRCFLQGDTPIMEPGLFKWRSPSGSEVIALSSDSIKSELTGNHFYIKWTDFVLSALNAGLEQAVFTNFSDFGSNPYFREECARVAYYAPVLGEYLTFTEVFERLSPPSSNKITKMDDYFMMPFPLEGPGRYPNRRAGSHMKVLQETFKCEHLLLSAETINAFCNVFCNSPISTLTEDFRKLLGYESHCVYIVGNSRSYELSSYYNIPYEGQITNLTYEDRGGLDILKAEKHGDSIIKEKIDVINSHLLKTSEGKISSALIFNPLSYRLSKVIEIPYKGQNSGYVTVKDSSGRVLPVQSEENFLLVRTELPSLGFESLSIGEESVTESMNYRADVRATSSNSSVVLENNYLIIEIDRNTGLVSQVYNKKLNIPLLKSKGMNFVFGSLGRLDSVPFKIEILEKGPVRGKVVVKGILLKDETIIAGFHMSTLLEADSELISFELCFDTLKQIIGIPWGETLRIKYTLDMDNLKVYRSYLNVIEETEKKQYNSPYFTVVSSDQSRVCFLNDGPQFYLRDKNTIEIVLTGEQDYTREFHWAIYTGDRHPLKASLSWQYPSLVNFNNSGVLLNDSIVGKSLLKSDDDNIIITGAIPIDDKTFKVRLYEISGRETITTLHSDAPIAMAEVTDEIKRELTFDSNCISLKVNPWEFITLKITWR